MRLWAFRALSVVCFHICMNVHRKMLLLRELSSPIPENIDSFYGFRNHWKGPIENLRDLAKTLIICQKQASRFRYTSRCGSSCPTYSQPPQWCLASVLLLLLPVIFPAFLLPLLLFHSYFLSTSSFSFPLQPPPLPFSCHLGSFLFLASVTTSLCPAPTAALKLLLSFLLAVFFPSFRCVCLQPQSDSISREHFLFVVKHVNLVIIFFYVTVFFFLILVRETNYCQNIVANSCYNSGRRGHSRVPNAWCGQITVQDSCTLQHLACHRYITAVHRVFFFFVAHLNELLCFIISVQSNTQASPSQLKPQAAVKQGKCCLPEFFG